MPHGRRWVAGILVIAGLVLPACAKVAEEEEAIEEPFTLEYKNGSDVATITLTTKAAERVDIQTDPALEAGPDIVIPYSAVFYTANGDTWAYTSTQPLTFQREQITVDHIAGTQAFLSDGLSPGTEVVTQGVTELYGTETDVEE